MDHAYAPQPSKAYQNVPCKEGRDGEKKSSPSKQFPNTPDRESQDGEKKYREIHSIYDWYHPDQTEKSAKRFLEEYPYEPLDQSALFLVHPHGEDKEDIKYVISCKWKMQIYQYRVRYKEEENVYTVRSGKASSLLDLVEQYRLAAVGMDGIRSVYTKDSALSHLMYPIAWPKKYKDRCYHGLLGREEAENTLQESFKKRDNCSPFLVRDSFSEPGKLVISGMFVKNSDKSNKFRHVEIGLEDKMFVALDCRESSLSALAKSIEEKSRNYGDLLKLMAIAREGYHGVDIEVLENFLPPSIKKMDESAINAYREALEEGSENYNHVRVMVVGYHGAGKSSLTKRLLRENVEEVRSTDGVEIFTKRGRFQLSDHAWIKYDGKQENENETLERIARYLTQRFPKGVPTYISLGYDYDIMSEMETSQAIEETYPDIHVPTESPSPYTNSQTKPWQVFPAKHPVTPRRAFELPSASSGFKQNRIPPPMNYENGTKHHRPSLPPPQLIKRPVSLPYKSHSPINASKPQSRPHFTDPIKNKCNSPSTSESESEDENRSNRDNEYGNNFSTVILDLKKKFVTSNEAQTLTMKKNCSIDETENDDCQKGSDCIEDARGKSLDRAFSFDESQGEQAMKDDLEELFQMSSKFLQNETGSITFWDFAGQTVFQTTHQAFMSSKAVYLLVTDISRPMNDSIEDDDDDCQCGSDHQKSVKDFLKFWFNTIHTYSSESQKGSPKILVVSTHKDKAQNGNKEIEEHFRDIKRVAKKKMLLPHLVPEMFCVDCNDEDEDVFDKIRSKILEIAKKENIFPQSIPTSWIYLERKIIDLRKKGKKVLSFSEVKKLNKFCALHLKDEKEIKVFLQFHHAIGNMLFYDEKGLDDIIVLNPQWLVDAFKCLITTEKFLGSTRNQADFLLEEMKKTGYLSMENIETLWSDREDPSYLENKEHIIKILERMDIIAKPTRYEQNGESSHEMSTFLVPCMMNVDSSNVRSKWLQSKNANKIVVPALGFFFKDEFMPPAVFYRLLAACMAKFPAVEQNDVPQVFANTAVFRLDKYNFLLLVHDDFLIRAWVLTFSNTAHQSSIRYTIRKFLEESLTIILEIYASCTACPDHKLTKRCSVCRKCNANFPFRVVVQCSSCLSQETTFKGLHFWGDLESNESVVCADHDEIHVIESTDMLEYWQCPKVEHSDNLSLSVRASRSSLESPISKPYQTLGRLARKVSGYWQKIAYHLELGDNFVETTKQNFPHLASDCCFHTLKTWFEKSADKERILQTLEGVFADIDIDRETLQMLDTVDIEWQENKYLEKEVTERGIDIICNMLGKKSYQLAIELGLLPEEIEQIQMDFRLSIARSREYINKWRQREKKHATYKVLLQALATVEVDNYREILSSIY